MGFKVPTWQTPLYEASIGVATLLDEIDNELGDDEGRNLYRHVEALQIQITRLENILYKEKSNGF